MGQMMERPITDFIDPKVLEGKKGELEVSFMMSEDAKKMVEEKIQAIKDNREEKVKEIKDDRKKEKPIEKIDKKVEVSNEIPIINRKSSAEDPSFPQLKATISQINPELLYAETEEDVMEDKKMWIQQCLLHKVQTMDVLNHSGPTCYVVGEAGNGKSVLLRQLFKESCENRISIYITLPDLTEEKYSLTTFLKAGLKQVFGVKGDESEQILQCIQSHHYDCQLFLDGLDEVEWSLPREYLHVGAHDEIHISQLLCNLLHTDRPFQLCKMKVLVAGRPMTVATLPSDLRSNVVFHCGGLSDDGARALFNYLTLYCKYNELPQHIRPYTNNFFNLQMISQHINNTKSKLPDDVTITTCIIESFVAMQATGRNRMLKCQMT